MTETAGRDPHSGPSEELCLNCGNSVSGERFCAHCGQERIEPVPSVGTLLHHFFDDVFSVDSKITRTLVPLVVRPGWLTREYLAGRQVHYVRPLRLYLVLSLVFFVLLSWFGEKEFVINTGGDLAAIDPRSTLVDTPVDSLAEATAEQVGEALRTAEFEDPVRATLLAEFARASLDSLWIAALSPTEDAQDDDDFASLLSVPVIGSRLHAQAQKLTGMNGDEFTQRMNASIVRNLPKGIFLLVPVFALVLKLYYVRRRRRYAEHFVFALHVHALAFLVFSVVIFVPWKIVDAVLVLLVWVYLLIAMKRVYAQGKFKTALKFVGLIVTYGLLLGFTVAGTALFSALTL